MNFNSSGSLLGKSNGMSNEDGVFGLQILCSVRMMSVTGESFPLFRFTESILSQNALTSSFRPVNNLKNVNQLSVLIQMSIQPQINVTLSHFKRLL